MILLDRVRDSSGASGAWFCRAECVLMQEYRAQLNRFTTLSSPGSHRLPPGLPAYVNPRIARQPQNMRNVLHLRLDRLHRVLLIILAMPACQEEAVCLLWDYVTPCPKAPTDLCPTQNHLLPSCILIPFFQDRQVYFRASNICKTRRY